MLDAGARRGPSKECAGGAQAAHLLFRPASTPHAALRVEANVLPAARSPRESEPAARVWSTAELLAARAVHVGANVALNYRLAPLHLVRGRAQYLYDAEGLEYLDCVNNVCHVGHCQPEVAFAASAQLCTLNTNARYLSAHALEYSQRLTATLPPPLRVVYFTNSGSEANDLALRLARAHTKRRGLLCVGGAYHGHVTAMVDASPYKFERESGGQRCVQLGCWYRKALTLAHALASSWVRQAAIPDVHSGLYRGNVNDEAMGAAYAGEVSRQLASFARQEAHEAARRAELMARRAALAARPAQPDRRLHSDGSGFGNPEDDEEEALLFELGDDDGLTAGCGAFFCESILSCGGQVVPPAGYLRAAHAAVRAAGGVCIADEVQCGFGRVGSHMWGFQLGGPDVVPDVVTMGKPVANGLPCALVVTTAEIAASFAATGEYFNTFGGNPVVARAALATLDVLQRDGLQERAAATGAVLLSGFAALQEQHDCIGSVRGVGLMLGLEMLHSRADAARRPWPEAAAAVVYAMRARRILLSADGMAGNVIKLKPPMVFSEDDARRVLRELADVFANLPQHLAAYDAL